MTTESGKSLAMNLKSSIDHRMRDMRDQVEITLRVIDLDHVLRINPPTTQTAESTADQKCACAQWERSNRMSIKNYIFVAIRGAIPNSENTKEYLSSLEEQLKGLQKPMQVL
ncbi:hypothetical protein Tco_1224901 [Tanacetum coccineum]